MIRATRRSAIGMLAAAGLQPLVPAYAAATRIRVNKDPSCGCCSGWVDHMKTAGFDVQVNDTAELNRIKATLRVPGALASCHTAEVDGYVIEGHVPATAVRRLLAERPSAVGLAVPGMPIGSPGMEVPGTPDDTYNVVLFGPALERVFARFKGARELP